MSILIQVSKYFNNKIFKKINTKNVKFAFLVKKKKIKYFFSFFFLKEALIKKKKDFLKGNFNLKKKTRISLLKIKVNLKICITFRKENNN